MQKLIQPAAAFMLLTLIGCRQDMQDQPRMYPQRTSAFFADGRSVRSQVSGTVARSQANRNTYFLTGMVEGKEADGLPFPLTLEVLARGQERYNIYCSPCHSRVGNGMGMIVQRGYHLAADFHSERLRQIPLGHLFSVITNGYGAMPNYAAELTPQDRWAVAAYIRALQLSQNARASDIAAGEKPEALQTIALRTGLPTSFADRWKAPTLTPAIAVAPPRPVQLEATAAPVAATAVVDKPIESAAPGKSPAALAPQQPAPPMPEAKAPPAAKAAGGDAEAGHRLYVQKCQLCHQPERTGMAPIIPGLIGVVDKIGPEKVRTEVMEGIPTGKPPMPPNPDFTPQDVDNLLAFLRTGK
jgi:mono/diheme cytochrome c family protein